MHTIVERFRLGVDIIPDWFVEAMDAGIISTTRLPGFNVHYDGSVIVTGNDGSKTRAVPGDYIIKDSIFGYFVEQGEVI